MDSVKYLNYNGAKFLILREEKNYFISIRKVKDKIAVYFTVGSRVDQNYNIVGENSAHVISCLKWESSLTSSEVKFAKKHLKI